ncbi:Uncharacterised protein g11193 [Pycnogonum litorale]
MDADLKHSGVNNCYLIWSNTIKIAALKLSRDGVLIMKGYVKYPYILGRILTTLTYGFSEVVITRLCSSRPNSEVYVIARGPIRDISTVRVRHPAPEVYLVIARLIEICHEDINTQVWGERDYSIGYEWILNQLKVGFPYGFMNYSTTISKLFPGDGVSAVQMDVSILRQKIKAMISSVYTLMLDRKLQPSSDQTLTHLLRSLVPAYVKARVLLHWVDLFGSIGQPVYQFPDNLGLDTILANIVEEVRLTDTSLRLKYEENILTVGSVSTDLGYTAQKILDSLLRLSSLSLYESFQHPGLHRRGQFTLCDYSEDHNVIYFDEDF